MRHSATSRPPAELAVGIILLPEFTLSAFSGFVDALRIASDHGDQSRQAHCRWTVVGTERSPVRSSCGVEITPWQTFYDEPNFDHLVVVGGLVRGHRAVDGRVLTYLREAEARGLTLVGICTGSFALARAGLMKGYRCCVHWYHRAEFLAEFPGQQVRSDTVFVRDGNRITCAGGQSAIDVALYLIERRCGGGLASKVVSAMVVENVRGPKHPQPHAESHWFAQIRDDLVRRSVLLIEQSTHRSISSGALAALLGVSASTLERSFRRALGMTPAELSRILRTAHGHWEVLNGNKAIAWIASDLGFSDASHFTRLHREYYGITPALARRGVKSRGKAPKAVSRVKPGGRLAHEILHSSPFFFGANDWAS